MPVIYNRPSGNTTLILNPFEFLCYPFNFGSYNEIRAGCGMSLMASTGSYLLAPASIESVTANSLSSCFYFGVKPYSSLMPSQETALGFIGNMMGADGTNFQIDGISAQGLVTSSANQIIFGYITGGLIASTLASANRFYCINNDQGPLNSGQTAYNGFSFKINSPNTASQNFVFTQFANSVSFSVINSHSNLNSSISGMNAKLNGSIANFTGYLGAGGPTLPGTPFSLPNSVFIYNPFS